MSTFLSIVIPDFLSFCIAKDKKERDACPYLMRLPFFFA
jgi:hypothetical protein